MMNNKKKLFLLLAVIFLFIPFQSSWGEYLESGMQCATFVGGIFKQFRGLDDNKYCTFINANDNRWDRYSYDYDYTATNRSPGTVHNHSGVSVKEIKVPYLSAFERIWSVIKSVSVPDSNLGANNDCNDEWPRSQIIPALYPYYLYDAVKTAIQNSCMPGNITTETYGGCTTNPPNSDKGFPTDGSSCLTCSHSTGYTEWWGGHATNRDIRNITPPVGNYATWSFSGCGPLESAMKLSISDTSAITGKKDSDGNSRNEVKTGGSFTLDWSISNPDAACTISGQNATLGGSISALTSPFTFDNVKTGIYTYILTCSGLLNGQISPDRGARTKQVTVYTSDVPDLPTVKDFNFVFPNDELIDISANSSTPDLKYQITIGKAFKISWDIANADSIIVYRTRGGAKTNIFSSGEKSGSIEIDTNLLTTGLYTFTIETANTGYPLLGKGTKNIMIIVGNVTKVDSPVVQFSADKTEVEKNEKATLTWNVSKAANISIDHEVGGVSVSGSTDVFPTVTTIYTLTATSPTENISPVKKTVTIKIKAAASLPAIQTFKSIALPEATTLPGGENKPTEKQATDLKVNSLDGPVTLNAPATFDLSWNIDKYCMATGSWLSVKFKAGTQSVTLNKNGAYTYSLYCPGYGSDSVTVNIVGGNNNGLLDTILGTTSEAEPMPTAQASISSDQINYSQNLKVTRGEPVNIYVKAENNGKTSKDAAGKWTDLLSNGGYCLYNTSLQKNPPKFDGAISNPVSIESCDTLLGNFTFNDAPGTYKYGLFQLLQNDKKFSNIAYVNITVENPPLPTTAPIIDLRINGNDNAEQVLGTPADYNITWDVTNADSCEASGSWSDTRALRGIQSFVSSIKKDFAYSLTCIGKLGTTTKSIILKIVESPSCTFTALPTTISKKSAFVTESELSWKCDYADECSLGPNITKQIKTYGSIRVSPDQTTTYSLDCHNSSVSKSFTATVTVE